MIRKLSHDSKVKARGGATAIEFGLLAALTSVALIAALGGFSGGIK